jgi:hypothetical protein
MGFVHVYSFQIIDKNVGPVEKRTVRYGSMKL